MVQEWLRDCTSNHDECRGWISSWTPMLPTRVLDLGNTDADLKLYHSEDDCEPYVALSHCWGNSQPLQTTKANLSKHCEHIDMKDLPATFRDAVLVTRILGIRYLWIDSLSIVQDDPDDWLMEAAAMGDVYAHAYITIAATRATDSTIGFLGPRDIHRAVTITTKAKEGDELRRFYLAPRNRFATDVDESLLARRAWILQERVLSPRTLHFTDTQIYWECWTKHQGEDLDGLGQGVQKKDMFPTQCSPRGRGMASRPTTDSGATPRQWFYLVGEYSASALTRQSDKLIAIGGLATHLANYTGMKYWSGIWEDMAHAGLLWSARAEKIESIMDVVNAPSWTWASRNGPINHLQLYSHEPNQSLWVEEVSGPRRWKLHAKMFQIPASVRFGPLESSIDYSSFPPELDYHPSRFRPIIIDGNEWIGWITIDEEDGTEPDYTKIGWVFVTKSIPTSGDEYEGENHDGHDDGGAMYCLLVMATRVTEEYVRVGVGSIHQNNLPDLPTVDITIV
jgi:hypothetical protein